MFCLIITKPIEKKVPVAFGSKLFGTIFTDSGIFLEINFIADKAV